MKRFIAALMCIIIIFGLVSCEIGKKDPDNTDVSENGTPKLSEEDAAKTVMNTEHYSLSMAELDYIFLAVYNDTLSSWRSVYGDSYATQLKSVMGLDIYLPLKDQMLMDNSSSYLEYFLSQTKSEARTLLLLCEWADENGIALTDSDKASIEVGVQSYVDAAEQNECTVAKLLGDPMDIITADTLRAYNEKNYLAIMAATAIVNSYEFSDEQIDEEFTENPKEHAVVDYLVYTFETSDSVSAETAKKSAEELAAVTSAEEFIAYAENYYNNVLNAGKTSFTEFNAENLEMNNIGYYEGVEYLEWMFDGAKEGECYMVSDDTNSVYNVYCLVNAPGENEYYLKNVRHILFKSSSFDSTDACKAEAERIYEIFKENPTEEYFAELANEYSEDRAADATGKTDGGLYENVNYNQMVSEFEDWTFDDARAEGDTGIIRTSYGYHIMYFSGNGEFIRTGHDSAKEALIKTSYGADLERLEADHPVTIDEEHLKKFDA